MNDDIDANERKRRKKSLTKEFCNAEKTFYTNAQPLGLPIFQFNRLKINFKIILFAIVRVLKAWRKRIKENDVPVSELAKKQVNQTIIKHHQT